MIRYVLLGAVVGFAVAYFLLSAPSKDLTAPPPDAPAQVRTPLMPSRENRRLERQRDNVERNALPVQGEAGPR